MNTVRRIALCVLCALMLLTAGCRQQPGTTDGDSRYTEPQQMPYEEIRFASEAQKRKWVKPLARLLSTMKAPFVGYDPDEETISYDEYLNGDGIIYSYSLALYDVDLDGVPELLCDMGGGSMGNGEFIAYDIYTGKIVEEHLGGTVDGGWCVYYDTESARYCHIGQMLYRIGWSERTSHIYRMWPGSSEEECVLHARYSCQTSVLTGDESELIWELYSTKYEGEAIPPEDYLSRYEAFFRTHIRIPQTEMTVYRGWRTGLTDAGSVDPSSPISPDAARETARMLLFSGQEFLLPNK